LIEKVPNDTLDFGVNERPAYSGIRKVSSGRPNVWRDAMANVSLGLGCEKKTRTQMLNPSEKRPNYFSNIKKAGKFD
jgi:hypothetical protein